MKRLTTLLASAALLLSLTATRAALWTGQGTTQNWNDANNWSSFAVPANFDQLYFEDVFSTGYTNAAGLVNNFVTADLTVGDLFYTAQSLATTNRFYTTQIDSGVTLTLDGTAAGVPVLAVGDVPGTGTYLNSGNWTNYATITGLGKLAIAQPDGVMSVSMRNRATLDLTGLRTFNAEVAQLRVGTSSDNPGTSGLFGWLLLGKTNLVRTPASLTTPGVLLGHATNANGSGVLRLGGANTFHTDGFVVGGRRSSGSTVSFGPAYSNSVSSGTFTLRGSAGGSTPARVFSIGDMMGNWNGYDAAQPGTSGGASSAVADFSGGSVDILADTIYIGRGASPTLGTHSGTGNGSLVVENGTVNANQVFLGYKPASTNASVGVGSLTLRSNAVMNVAQNFWLVLRTNGTTFVDESKLNVNDNAVLRIGGNLTSLNIGSWTPPSLSLAGGTIHMTNGGTVSVPRLAGFGAISNSSSVTVTNSFTPGLSVTVSSVVAGMIPGTLDLGGNLTLTTNVPVRFKLGSSTTVGSGVNDYVKVGGGVNLAGTRVEPTFMSLPSIGTYTLMDYNGAKTGNFVLGFTNTTRNYTFALDQSQAGKLLLNVAGSPGINLTWKGGANGVWDITNNANWNNNTEKFYTYDNVVFDDNGVQPIITVPSSATVQPGNITFNNSAVTYNLYGQGKISGPASLTKNGPGLALLSGGGFHDYTGPINVNQGTLQVQVTTGSGNAFGATNKTITVASGATLDIYGNTVGSGSGLGWPVVISGHGVGGIGAIAHTKPTGGPTFYATRLTLAGDATIGVTAVGVNLFVNSPISTLPGVLDLGGYTLTTSGGGTVALVNMIITNSGSILVNGSSLTLRDVVLDGPGSVVLGGRNLNLGGNNAWSAGSLAKPFSIGPASIVAANSGPAVVPFNSPVSLTGPLTVNNAQDIRFSGVISGTDSLTKIGAARAYLAANNTWSGPAIISGGSLVLESAGALANSPLAQVRAGASMDVTRLPGSTYTLPAGQTVQADGIVTGSLIVPAGATLSGSAGVSGDVTVNGGNVVPGLLDLPRTLGITNLTLNNATVTFELGAQGTPGNNVNDLISAANLNFQGISTIKIVPIGTLSTVETYTLFQYTGAALPSSITNNLVLTSDTRYTFAFVDPATTPGTVQISVVGAADALVWRGGVAGNATRWDINTTSNFFKGASRDKFFNGDTVTFEDTALTNRVTLAVQVRPSTMTLQNYDHAYTFDGAGSLRAGAIVSDSSLGFVLANSSSNAITGAGLTLNAGSVTFNQPVDSSFSGTLNGFPGVAVNKAGANTLTMIGDNSISYSGAFNINAGTVQPASSNALGSGAVTIASGAALDLSGQVINTATISVSGSGIGGRGAILNSGGAATNTISKLLLEGDTTLNSSNRWDVMPGTASIVQGQGHDLTKVGPGEIWFNQGSDSGFGDIDVQQGRLIFASLGTDLGDPGKLITVRSNAALAFANDVVAGTKPTVVQPGGRIESAYSGNLTGYTNIYAGDIQFQSRGVLKPANNSGLTLAGSITSPSGLVVSDRGVLRLYGSNAYSGDLTLNLGSLVIGNSNALPPGTTVTMDCTGNPSSDNVFLDLAENVVTPTNVNLTMRSYRTPAGPLVSTLSGSGTWQGSVVMHAIQTDPSQDPQMTFNGATNLVVSRPVIQTGSPTVTLNIRGFPGTVSFQSPLTFNGLMMFGSTALGLEDFGGIYTTMELNAPGNAFTNVNFTRGKIRIGADNAFPPACLVSFPGFGSGTDLGRSMFDLNGCSQAFSNLTGGVSSGLTRLWIGNDSTNADATVVFNSPLTNTWFAWIVDNISTNTVNPRRTGLTVSNGFLRLGNLTWGGWGGHSIHAAATNNTWTGPTRVVGGGLQIDAPTTNTSITVSGTGRLAGMGPINGPVTIASGGILAPGGGNNFVTAIGRMTNNSTLTLQAGSTCWMEVNLSARTNDAVVGLASLTYGGTLVITNVGAQAFTNGASFQLFGAANYVPGPISIVPATPGTGLFWDTTQLAVNGTLRVAQATTPVVGGPAKLGDGNIGFNINGTAGQAYSVRATTNVALPIASWTVIESGTLPSASYFFTDTTATNYPGRYYRVSTP